MRWVLLVGLCACSAAPSRATRHAPQPLAVAPPQPALPAPTDTWHVDLEVPAWQARPGAIAADASGVYITGPVFDPGNVQVRRWGVAKLDRATGAPLWSVIEDVPNGPMPERMALGDGVLIIAGNESNYAQKRSEVFERRDVKSGALVWRHVIPEGRTGVYTLGGISLTATTMMYAGTVESKPPTATFGELQLATGDLFRAHVLRENLRGRDIIADGTTVYYLGDHSDGTFALETLTPTWREVAMHKAGSLLRLARADGGGVVGWFRTIEKYAASGERVWQSSFVGDFVDVAIDGSGIYACAMIDASTKPYFAIARLDPATGRMTWQQRVAEYGESRPTSAIAVDAEAIYVLGYVGDRWYVERRRKADAALGDVSPALHRLPLSEPAQLAH
jgi:hypothetical protein